MNFDVIIIGAGAAGLFCASVAGARGRKVLVLEKSAKVGQKILISGGGRCNFTNREVAPKNYVSQNPHFCKSALARYPPQDFIELVERHNIEYYEKKLGQLFCRDSARLIVQMLVDECERCAVEIRTNCAVETVEKLGDGFLIKTSNGEFQSESLVIATGGLSFPKIGATDFGLKIARQFNLKIVNPRPALVPLIFNADELRAFGELAGISLNVAAKFGDAEFRENVLFTHRGFSGPAVLQISNYWQPNNAISFDLLPETDALELLQANRASKQSLVNFLSQRLPNRFVEKFCAQLGAAKPLDKLSNKELETTAAKLRDWRIKFTETEGWHKAEVMLGGVSTDELSSKTMAAKAVENLYFIGEVVDVTGWLGGYNFQWAWASGFAAAQFC